MPTSVDYRQQEEELKNMTTEQLEEMLRNIRQNQRHDSQSDDDENQNYDDPKNCKNNLSRSFYQNCFHLANYETDQFQNYNEEAHPDGERLIEPGFLELEPQIWKLLVQLAEYRTKTIDTEEDIEDAADIFLELNALLLEKASKKVMEVHKGIELIVGLSSLSFVNKILIG